MSVWLSSRYRVSERVDGRSHVAHGLDAESSVSCVRQYAGTPQPLLLRDPCMPRPLVVLTKDIRLRAREERLPTARSPSSLYAVVPI